MDNGDTALPGESFDEFLNRRARRRAGRVQLKVEVDKKLLAARMRYHLGAGDGWEPTKDEMSEMADRVLDVWVRYKGFPTD
jgi:hypothetical protein